MTKLRPDGWFGFVSARSRKAGSIVKLGLVTVAGIVFMLCIATAIASVAPILTTLVNFDFSNGSHPLSSLIQGTDGNFYGTTSGGGANNEGTVFKITPEGTLTVLHSFDITGGNYSYAGLVQATDGNFYGTTSEGGTYRDGRVFKITPGGTLTTLHSFDGTDGANPYARLVQATNGNFYGTTSGGGTYSYGTVFKITPGGTLTTLHTFDITDGKYPFAGLVQGTDGNFYGTTLGGGDNRDDTVFKITPGGTLTTLHSFDGIDGSMPFARLVQATNGNFYGTTEEDGTGYTYGYGTVFSLSVGLGPFVETRPVAGKVGAAVIILGNSLTGTTDVSFNGTAATFTVVSDTEITTILPDGATTGQVEVTTPSGTLTSNGKFHVQ
jgi:uncharacterized repeat protein (TIGR03803 family)